MPVCLSQWSTQGLPIVYLVNRLLVDGLHRHLRRTKHGLRGKCGLHGIRAVCDGLIRGRIILDLLDELLLHGLRHRHRRGHRGVPMLRSVETDVFVFLGYAEANCDLQTEENDGSHD